MAGRVSFPLQSARGTKRQAAAQPGSMFADSDEDERPNRPLLPPTDNRAQHGSSRYSDEIDNSEDDGDSQAAGGSISDSSDERVKSRLSRPKNDLRRENVSSDVDCYSDGLDSEDEAREKEAKKFKSTPSVFSRPAL